MADVPTLADWISAVANLLTAVFALLAFCATIFTFKYVSIGQRPIIEVLNWRKTLPEDEGFDNGYMMYILVRNLRRHTIYVRRIIFDLPGHRISKITSWSEGKEVRGQISYASYKTKCYIQKRFELEPGAVKHFSVDIQALLTYPPDSFVWLPTVSADITEYIPFEQSYSISRNERLSNPKSGWLKFLLTINK